MLPERTGHLADQRDRVGFLGVMTYSFEVRFSFKVTTICFIWGFTIAIPGGAGIENVRFLR